MIFLIKPRLPSLNEVIDANRSNPYKGAALKRDTESIIMWSIKSARAAGTVSEINPVGEWSDGCDLLIIWHEDNHKRDVDNIQSSTKFILDALVKLRILPNDSSKYVRQIYHYVSYPDNPQHHVSVYIRPHVEERGWIYHECDVKKEGEA